MSILAGSAGAADDCLGQGTCRQVADVKVAGGGTVTVDRVVPWVDKGRLLLFGGETVIFRLAADGGTPQFVQAGKGTDRPLADGEMRVKLEGDRLTMMTIQSGHKRWLDYRAEITLADGRGGRTSVCTVMAGKAVFESWPDPIVLIAIGDFKAAPDGQAACK
jgi:hypothetical protein